MGVLAASPWPHWRSWDLEKILVLALTAELIYSWHWDELDWNEQRLPQYQATHTLCKVWKARMYSPSVCFYLPRWLTYQSTGHQPSAVCCRGFCAEAEMGLMMLIPHNNFYPLWTLCVLKLIIFQRKWWMDKILSAGLRYQLKPAAGVSWTWDWDDWELCKEVSGLIIIIIISTSWNEKQKMLNIASFPSGIMADKLKINPR